MDNTDFLGLGSYDGVGGSIFSGGTGIADPGLVGPNSDGTYTSPALAQPINQPSDVGSGSNLAQYTPQVLQFLTSGLTALNSDWQFSKLLNYQTYQASQGGLVAQGQAAASVQSAQIAAASSSRNIMLLMIMAGIYLLAKEVG